MQFLAALVEHLVVGVVALLWLLPLADQLALVPNVKISDHKEVLIAVGLPVSYVVGMYVDVLASPLTALLRRLLDNCRPGLRASFFGGHLGTPGHKSYQRTASILKHSPDEAAKYFLQLSGREKIARGVALNFVMATIVNLAVPHGMYSVPCWLLALLGIVGVLVWLRLNALTDTFKSHW